MAVDLQDYINLTVFDADPLTLVERAKVDAQTKLPGWVPRQGNTELVVIESVALIVAELVYAVNRVPAAVVEVLLRLYGVTRDPGAPPTTTVRFDLADSFGHTIPAGTRVRYVAADNTIILFLTDTDVTAAPAATTATVAATGTKNTSSANGVASGQTVDVLDSIVFVDDAVTTAAIGNGRDPEDTATWLSRAIQRLARLNDALVLPTHFTAYALGTAGVYRATTLDRYDPGTGPSPGSNNGHVTVAVMGQAGVAVSAPIKAALLAEMVAKASAHLVVHVIDATVTNVAVTVTVVAATGYTNAEVQANVTAALQAYLNPDTWAWGATVYRNELIALIDGVTGVDRVTTLTLPATDVTLAGFAPLANDGTITVTVT